MRVLKGDAEGQKKCLDADEVQLLYHYFLNAYFLYNVVFLHEKSSLVYMG